MPLPSRVTHIPAGLAIDELTRPELLPIGQANVQNRNVRNIEQGALEKRLGTVSLDTNRSDGTSRTAGRKLFDHKGRACTFDGSIIDELALEIGAWVPRGQLPEAHFRLTDLPSASFNSRVVDVVEAVGHIIVLFGRQTDTTVTNLWEYATVVIDATTKTVVRSIEVVASGAQQGVALASFATYVAFGACTAAFGGRVDFSVLDLSSAATIATGWTSIATEVVAGTSAQLAMSSGTDRFYAAFDNGSDVLVRAIALVGVVQTKTLTSAGAPVTDTICLSEGAEVLWVAWSDVTNVTAAALSLTSLTTVVGTSANVLGVPADYLFITHTGTAAAAIATNESSGLSSNTLPMHVRSIGITAGAVVPVGQAILISNARMCSRPFLRSNKAYGWFTSVTGDSCVMADWTPPLDDPHDDPFFLRPVVAPVDRGLVDSPVLGRSNVQARTVTLDSTTMFAAFAVKKTGLGTGALGVEIDFADREIGNSVLHHGITYLCAGVTSLYDGASVAEAGFLVAPSSPSADTSNAGPLTFTRGGRNYVAIYAWTDAVSNLHLSGISPTSGLTGNVAAKKIMVSVGGLSMAADRPIDVMVYATTDGGEPPYYFVGAASNDPNNIVTITDNLSDLDLSARSKLYAPQLPGAVGEALDRRAPAGLRNLISYAGMLVGTVNDTIVFSGQEVSGEGAWFSPIFEVPVVGPAFTGLSSLDGYVVGFKEGLTITVNGESPSDNGAAGGFGTPRVVSADYGCIDCNTIVSTALGLFFQSVRGLELFTRSQTIEWIGEPMIDTLATYPIITSAVVDGRNSIVRFTLAKSVTDGVVAPYIYDPPDGEDPVEHISGGGADLIFDLSMKNWISVDDRATPTAAQHAATVRFAGQSTNLYAWLESNGVVHVERSRGDSLECRDDSSFITSQYTTPPMTFGLQQEQRVFEVEFSFQKITAADLVIEVAENYGAFGAVTSDKVWLDADITTAMVTFRPKSHGNAVQFRVRDRLPEAGTDTESGRGITFIGLSTDAAPKQGQTRGTTRTNTGLRR